MDDEIGSKTYTLLPKDAAAALRIIKGMGNRTIRTASPHGER